MTVTGMTPSRQHHAADGGFRNPWPTVAREGSFLRWMWERRRKELPPSPSPSQLPHERSDVAHPRAAAGEMRATWVGHATFLLQVGGLNVLTDPHWSRRASPFSWAGPKRFVPPGLDWEDLPPIDVVVISHDHYDHLDASTVRRIVERFGHETLWLSPLGFRPWLERHGAVQVRELDWWEETTVESSSAEVRFVCLPAQHWCNRAFWDNRVPRLWCSWMIATEGGRLYFGGDSGWFPGYTEIGAALGPFDLTLLPIGAYEPRWFMRPIHMNPEEAVGAYGELGGQGVFGAMHWGTFRLTDEDPLEPPVRLRASWERAGHDPGRLWIPRHGATLTWRGEQTT